jgi:hypothetical protein
LRDGGFQRLFGFRTQISFVEVEEGVGEHSYVRLALIRGRFRNFNHLGSLDLARLLNFSRWLNLAGLQALSGPKNFVRSVLPLSDPFAVYHGLSFRHGGGPKAAEIASPKSVPNFSHVGALAEIPLEFQCDRSV